MTSEEDFNEWYNAAPAEYFKKYLKDSAREMVDITANTIAGGGILNESEQVQVAVECATLTRIREIEYAEIVEFYREDE